MQLLHTMIRVKDIQKSLDFYQNILGLKLDRVKELDDCKLYFLKDEISGFEIELTDNDEIPECGYTLGNTLGHFAFLTDNMDDFTKVLEANGLKYLYEPFHLGPVSSTIAFITDPDGVEIEIIQKNK